MASLSKRLLTAFIVFVYSSQAFAAAPTTVPAKSLFGFELQLDQATIWKNSSGVEYIGWPKADAEAILEVFEKRIPLLLKINEDCKQLEGLSAEHDRIQESTKGLLNEKAATWQSVAEAWKETAHEIKPSWLERVFTSPIAWFILGVAGGATLAKWLLKQ